jgi:Calcineurin-like phosphoesterase
MPNPDKLLKTLYKAAEAVRWTNGRKGRFVQLQDASEVFVAGDLHGHVGNFQAIYQAADLAKNPKRHLVLQEVVHGKFFYPGGGDKSHQLLDLFAALKCQFPAQVHLLLGNHELAQWTKRMVMKDDRDLNVAFTEGVNEAYGPVSGPAIYDGYMRLFGLLPLALRTGNRIMLSHSLPREKALAKFELRHLETDTFPPEDLTVGGSVFELLWGRDTRAENCGAFLKKVDADWLVSGHIACEAGFARPSPRHLIVDCCGNPAAYAVLPANRPLTIDDFAVCVRVIGAVPDRQS